MPSEPRWVPLDAVAALNREEVEKTGEPHQLLNRTALEIAVSRPWNVWVYFTDQDYARLATALLVAVGGAKAFDAGNERTAYRAAVALLEWLYGRSRRQPGARRGAALRIYRRRLSQVGVADWFKTWMSAA